MYKFKIIALVIVTILAFVFQDDIKKSITIDKVKKPALYLKNF